MSAMKTILVIYENIPESTDMFLLLVTPAEAEKIMACAGCFINSSDDWEERPTQWLSEFLEDKTKIDVTKPFDIQAGTTVVHTGFMM